MTNYSAVLIDDEVHCIETLKHDIAEYCPEITIQGTETNPIKAIELIINTNPDIIFLDVQMPNLSGFDVLRSLPEINSHVIFVTAYDEYALKAFSFSAVDYLLKPVDSHALKKSINRIKEQQSILLKKSVLSTLTETSSPTTQKTKIALTHGPKTEIVVIDDIIRCEADGNYCKIYLVKGKEIYLSKTLKQIEHQLVSNSFLRVHKKHLINIKHALNYIKSDGGVVTMSDNTPIPISRFSKTEIVDLIIKGK